MVRHATDRHQHKRAYQPQITSFYHSTSHDASLPASSATHATLAPSEQSSLLSVGMRIRKAVPEGYKTHKTMPLSSLSATRLNAALPTNSVPATHLQSENPSQSQRARPRELQPFCGIHRVGGMAVQETMLDSINGCNSTTSIIDDFDNFASSQESNVSIAGEGEAQVPSVYSHSGKRSLNDEDDEDELPNFFLDSASNSINSSRIFAKPRSRRKDASNPTLAASTAFGFSVDMDFDDAPFLKPLDHDMDDS